MTLRFSLFVPAFVCLAAQAGPSFPLPLPKGYKIPDEVKEIIVGLLKESKSVGEFKAQYRLRYQAKGDLKAWLLDKIEDKVLAILNAGERAAGRGNTLDYYASQNVAKELMDGEHSVIENW